MKLEAMGPSAEAAAPAGRRGAAGGSVQGRAEHRSGSTAAPAGAPRDRRDSRWDEHRRARRAALVEAAVVAVGRHGAGVGMDEIAAVAGTSKTVVYRHFADRGDLHAAVCTRVAEQLVPTLRAAMTSSDQPRDMLGAAIEAYLAFLEADPELYRFVVHPPPGAADSDDPITGLSDLVGEQAAAILAPALGRAGRDPVAAAPWGHAVVGLVRAAADWWLRAGRPMPRRDLAAHLTDLAWAGLSGVVTPASPEEDL
ncbi:MULTISPECIES: TetR family transcriptional regulator [unclassified Blastococcus]|uniref:TetR family transcriptional regulator n=1 Tax=unclassified Blastococcus TaxID=2619396 RepID=UPI001EF144D7|nr:MULTISPECIES: TetR family transcriptional regulator [unclassified Blastococcus]